MASAEPMFRIIAKGEVELDAEASELQLSKIKEGQTAKIDIAGAGTIVGTVRLVSPQVNKSTRLGRVRVFLGANDSARVGAFARGTIETAKSRNLGVPQSAVLFSDAGATVQAIVNDKVETRSVDGWFGVGRSHRSEAGPRRRRARRRQSRHVPQKRRRCARAHCGSQGQRGGR